MRNSVVVVGLLVAIVMFTVGVVAMADIALSAPTYNP